MIAYILLSLLGICFLLILWIIAKYNSIVRLQALNNEAFSGVDVQYKRRSDLVPNLVAVVKQYSIHEKEVLENVTRMRSLVNSSADLEHKAQAEAGLTGALKTLFAVAENYPELKANENFLALQKDLTTIENDLQLARRYYNGTARNYNTQIRVFPINIIASQFNFEPVAYFELASDQERQAPKVTF
jgi:LemA protein